MSPRAVSGNSPDLRTWSSVRSAVRFVAVEIGLGSLEFDHHERVGCQSGAEDAERTIGRADVRYRELPFQVILRRVVRGECVTETAVEDFLQKLRIERGFLFLDQFARFFEIGPLLDNLVRLVLRRSFEFGIHRGGGERSSGMGR